MWEFSALCRSSRLCEVWTNSNLSSFSFITITSWNAIRYRWSLFEVEGDYHTSTHRRPLSPSYLYGTCSNQARNLSRVFEWGTMTTILRKLICSSEKMYGKLTQISHRLAFRIVKKFTSRFSSAAEWWIQWELKTEIANISNQQRIANVHTTNKIANSILCNKSIYEFNALHVRTYFCVQVIWGFSSLSSFAVLLTTAGITKKFHTQPSKSIARLWNIFQWQFVCLGATMTKDLVEKIAFSSIKYFLCVRRKMFRSDLCWLGISSS